MKKFAIATFMLLSIFLLGACSNQGYMTQGTGPNNTLTPKKRDKNVPKEYNKALDEAEMLTGRGSYYSKLKVYELLTDNDKYDVKAAQYAIDNVDADWNRNALNFGNYYAKQYLMSKEGIYRQLSSDEDLFTLEEAQYAVDNLRIDWKKNAYRRAQSYQERSMSTEEIRTQLTSPKGDMFTEEEANYAIAHLPN